MVLQVVVEVRAVNPVIVGQVRADQPAAIGAMARRAERREGLLALGEHRRVLRRGERGDVRLELGQGGRFDLLADPFRLVLRAAMSLPLREDVVVNR